MTLNGGIKCTDVSAILPSTGWHEEIIVISSCHPVEGSIAETSVHFIRHLASFRNINNYFLIF